MIRIFISAWLSFFLFFEVIHAVEYHNLSDDYNICNQDCSDESHHFLSHYCDKCYVESNKTILITRYEVLSAIKIIKFVIDYVQVVISYCQINLYIRPPPKSSFF